MVPLTGPDGSFHPSLKEILSISKLPIPGSFSDLVELTQRTWLRPKGQEKWEVDASWYEHELAQLIPHLQQLGFINSIEPEPGRYDYGIIFGFVTMDMRQHVDFIAHYLDKISINHVVLLTSSLPVPFCTDGTTEADLMQEIIAHSPLADMPCTIINLPMMEHNGTTRRPTTDDTIQAWLQTNPQPGRALALSAQPFICRQTRLLQTIMPTTFSFIPAGPAAPDKLPIALYLDELARALYQELQYRTKE